MRTHWPKATIPDSDSRYDEPWHERWLRLTGVLPDMVEKKSTNNHRTPMGRKAKERAHSRKVKRVRLMKISKNFTLEEFLVSQTAVRAGIDMTPPLDIQNNIIRFVETIVQPLRDELGSPIIINSGFRPDAVNTLIGGSKTSAHRFGCAGDMRSNAMSPLGLAKMIEDMDLPYDQVIHEFGAWVHCGIRWDDTIVRKEELTAYRNSLGKTVYIPGLHAMEGLV